MYKNVVRKIIRTLVVIVISGVGLIVVDHLWRADLPTNASLDATTYIMQQQLPTPPNAFTADGCPAAPDWLPGHDFRAVCLQYDMGIGLVVV